MKFCFQILVTIVSMIASITSSVQEFCEIQRINSVFNIDEDIYVVDKDVGQFWRYDSNSNDFKADPQIQTIALNFTFKVNEPIFSFKFSQLYECSKDPINCLNPNFDFEDIDYCNKSRDYCEKAVKLKDIIILIGFDSTSKQSYQALRRNSNGFDIVQDLYTEFKPNSILSNATFLPLESDEELVSIIYRQFDYEMAILLKSKGTNELILKLSSLKQPWWFKHWIQYNLISFKNSIGLFQKGLDVFGVTPIDYTLYKYDVYGPQNSSRRFNKTHTNLRTSFNCSDNSLNTSLSSISPNTTTNDTTESTQQSDEQSLSTTTIIITTLTTSGPINSNRTTPVSDEPLPETDPWLLVIIPVIIIILIVLTAIFAYYWFLKPKDSDYSKHTTPQVKDIHNILNRDSN